MSLVVPNTPPEIDIVPDALPVAPSSSGAPEKRSTPIAKRRRAIKDDDEEGEFDETRSVDSDDAGSIVDFVVDEEGEEEDDDASVESEGPRTEEEAHQRELDGIDTSNIITGKRTRRQTTFYEQTVLNTDEYRKMMLEDVPEDEMHALMEEEEEEEEEEEDGSYETESSENGESEEDEPDATPSVSPTEATK